MQAMHYKTYDYLSRAISLTAAPSSNLELDDIPTTIVVVATSEDGLTSGFDSVS
jgi:hypothetical protein